MSTVTPVEPALDVASADELDWNDEADVIIVGWGAAGACAAIEARAAGASVRVIDRFSGGGASVLSGGVVYAGGGTPQQREAGYADSPEAMADYLRHEVQGAVSDATVLRFCRDSVANLQWLQAHGVMFGATMPATKTSYPPDGAYLYHSGNEVVPAYAGQTGTPPPPRGHRAVARGQSGAVLYAALKGATLKAGAQPVTQTAVRRLVRERGTDGRPGRVVGVQAWQMPAGDPRTRRHAELEQQVAAWRLTRPAKAAQARSDAAALEQQAAQPVFLRARRAVVLATGGFIYNPALMAEHAPGFRRGWPIGGAGCDGSGLRLGQSVGGVPEGLSNVSAWRFITPPSAWPRALVVNARGERFCNEQVYGATLGHHIVARQGGKAWLVMDARLRRQALRESLVGWLFKGLWTFQALPALVLMLLSPARGRTLADLAGRIGADPQSLQASVAAANAAASGESEDPFGKSPDQRQRCDQGPFFALDISIGSRTFPLATLTLGGLKVNEDDGHVRDQHGHDIPGLYAAGRTAIGLPSGHYVSGLSLADCVFSGRRAGRAAAGEPTGRG